MERRLQFHPHLYLGESISEKKLDKIKRKLRHKPLMANVYLLTRAQNAEDQLEIFDAKQLIWRYYRKYPPYIIGIAANYDEAVLLVEQIVTECLTERGDCALKEYLM